MLNSFRNKENRLFAVNQFSMQILYVNAILVLAHRVTAATETPRGSILCRNESVRCFIRF